MTGELRVEDAGPAWFAAVHDRVGEELSGLLGAWEPAAADVARTQGTIAAGVHDALGGATRDRDGAMRAGRSASATIADLLRRAGERYAAGDGDGAERLRAAAEELSGELAGDTAGDSTAAGGAGAAASGPGAGSGSATGPSGGAGTAAAPTAGGGQADQLSQLGPQAAQAVAQGIQGLLQGLAAIPGQVIAGMQQFAGPADEVTKAGAHDGSDDGDEDEDGDGDGDGDPNGGAESDTAQEAAAESARTGAERADDVSGGQHDGRPDGHPGPRHPESTASAIGPEGASLPPAVPPRVPAPTRPQQSPV